MQKLRLNQTLTQKLSPQKLQLIKLLQVPSVAMQSRIEQEIASNPALEEDSQVLEEAADNEERPEEDWPEQDTDMAGYQTSGNTRQRSTQGEQVNEEARLRTAYSLGEELLKQLSFLQLDKRQYDIGAHLIGSIEADGYLRRDLETIVNELAFTQYIESSVQEVEIVLKKIQRFDPPGIGARNLQECLLIQLEKLPEQTAVRQLATQIITQCFEEFTKKHYEKMSEKLAVESPQLLKDALALITKLDPKPGSQLNASSTHNAILHPDFIVTKQGGQLQVALTNYRAPALRTSKSYVAMLNKYKQQPKREDKMLQEAAVFAKKKLEAAQWFIEAVKQRQHTLLNTMKAIVRLQHDFFMEEEEKQLKPMVLKAIATEIRMDVSTVSRIVNNKSVQTDLGVYPLKYFFTEAITTDSGEDVSNRAVKKAIEELIETEDKQRPYADDKIAALLQAQGYHVARRTVAKYREQLNIPVARLRKTL